MSDDTELRDDGFELAGEFYRWALSDNGKDLMLIDRFTNMPFQEFFELVEDDFDRGRAPVLLALMATSIRAKHPEWTVERITRLVLDTNLSTVEFVAGDVQEDTRPLPDAGPATGPPTSEPSRSPSNGSSPSQAPTGDSIFEELSESLT
jgi:hypothetical protein